METTSVVSEVYQYITGKLSLDDRLQLAAMILGDITKDDVELIEKSDFWTDQDQSEISAFSLSYASDAFSDQAEGV